MAPRDYYDILGVERGSADDKFKTAYRSLAKKYHPDANRGNAEAEKKFKEIGEAYDVLKDPQKRAAYDRFGHSAGAFGASGRPGSGGFQGQDLGDVFGDILGDFFGGSQRGRESGRQQGEDLGVEETLTFLEAAKGANRTITVRRRQVCESCGGTGQAGGGARTTCSTCGGRGQIRHSQGFFSIAQTCPRCRGAGKVVDNPCRKCSGGGTELHRASIQVKVPAGVEDGTHLRVSGEGQAGGPGTEPGDLYVLIHVKAHPVLSREGAMVFCDVPVTFAEAALGGQIPVPTLDGVVQMKIPEGTQNGGLFRLAGKGFPRLDGGRRGDQQVRVVVEIPKKLSKENSARIRDLDVSFGEKNQPEVIRFRKEIRKKVD